jgi:hypothetical protein
MAFGNLIFMLVLFVFGVMLVSIAGLIDKNVDVSCSSTKLKNANRGVLIIGVTFIVSSLSFVVCRVRCDCGPASGFPLMIYSIFNLVIGLILLVLGSVIHSQSSDKCDIVEYAMVVWGVATIMVVGSLIHLGMIFSDTFASSAKNGSQSLTDPSSGSAFGYDEKYLSF